MPAAPAPGDVYRTDSVDDRDQAGIAMKSFATLLYLATVISLAHARSADEWKSRVIYQVYSDIIIVLTHGLATIEHRDAYRLGIHV